MASRVLRMAAGLVLGAVSAAVELVLAVPVLIALAVPAARAGVYVAARTPLVWERRRVERLLAAEPSDGEPSGPRALTYLAARVPVGLLGGAVLGLLGAGVTFAGALVWAWLSGYPFPLDEDPVHIGWLVVLYYLLPGIVLLYLALAGAAGIVRWERTLLRRLTAPTREERLAHRVEELARARNVVVAAVDDERRRIERDLHDGVQQRLVALGMLLGRARRHPEPDVDLLAQAHDQAQRALVELREVTWRVYPAALDTDGLAAALESVADRAPLPVRVRCDLDEEPPASVRAVAWFVACEAVTNAAKHSGAGGVDVRVSAAQGTLRTAVRDDGRGGADPSGGGLAGLARRVAAADGTFSVSSPRGGPTVVEAVLPCG